MAGSRAAGTNPRETGTNPRAGGAGGAAGTTAGGAAALIGAQMQVAALEAQLAQFRLINAQQDSAAKKQKAAAALQGKADKQRVNSAKTLKKSRDKENSETFKMSGAAIAAEKQKATENRAYWAGNARGALIALGTVGALYAVYLKISDEYRRTNMTAASNAKIMHGSFADMANLQRHMKPMDEFLNLPAGWSEDTFGRMRDELGMSANNATALLAKLQTAALPENIGTTGASQLTDVLIENNKQYRTAKQHGWAMRLTARQIQDQFEGNLPVMKAITEEMQKTGKATYDAKEYNRLMNGFLDSASKVKLPNPDETIPAWQRLETYISTSVVGAIHKAETALADMLGLANGGGGAGAGANGAKVPEASVGGALAYLVSFGQTDVNGNPNGSLYGGTTSTPLTQHQKDNAAAGADQQRNAVNLMVENQAKLDALAAKPPAVPGSLRLATLKQWGATDADIAAMGLSANDRGGLVTGVSGGIANVRPAAGEGLASIGAGERIMPAGGGFGGGNITIHQTNHLAVNEAASGKELAQDFALESAQAFVQQLALAGVGVGA